MACISSSIDKKEYIIKSGPSGKVGSRGLMDRESDL